MSDKLGPVWQQVELLLNEGVSLMPVRDKEEVVYGKIRKVKTPYELWEKYKVEIASRQELFHKMDKYNTNAVAAVCGKVSGNLEVIDIDVKYESGVDARLFNDLRTMYPDLLARLRVHKSPSGGYHILYRVEPGFIVPGNQKLAKRPATDEELLISPKEKVKCFIETRGEGGYIMMPPSMGYTIAKNNPIPTISAAERNSIITLASCYNRVVKVDKPPKTPFNDNYYSENPFEHFNNSPEGESVLLDYGWKFAGNSGDYVHYTRPGKEDGISASFIKSKRVFYIFTSNSELENERGYRPATILSILRHGNDAKQTFQDLVRRGYGRIKPEVEQALAKKAAITGKALPANVSEEAKQVHEQISAHQEELHPYGIFWMYDDEGKIKIDRENLYQVAAGLGFRYHNEDIFQIVDCFIHARTKRYFFDTLKEYIAEEDPELLHEILNSFESFIQRSGSFSIERIKLLEEDLIIKDTRDICYKFYKNGYVKIESLGYDLHEYNTLQPNLVWASKVQDREFIIQTHDCLYTDFLERAVELSQNQEQVMRVLGYLAHDYKDETTGYIIVLTEKCQDPAEGGGTGKNIFCNLLRHTTTFTGVPASQVQKNEKLLQSWTGQKIFAISDAEEKFDFAFLKSLITDGAVIKKLFKNEVTIGIADVPKFIVQTNYSYHITDGGVKRRVIPIEFTDFFTRCGGVDVHYKKQFPNDWSPEDWLGYDNFICACVQKWMICGLKLSRLELSDSGWKKQFDSQYGDVTREFIEDYLIEEWIMNNEGFVFNSKIQEDYSRFMDARNQSTYKMKFRKLQQALQSYCDKHGYTYEKNIQRKHPQTMKNEKGNQIYTNKF